MAKNKSLYTTLCTVTPASRVLALILFIVLPIAAFFLGLKLGLDSSVNITIPATHTEPLINPASPSLAPTHK